MALLNAHGPQLGQDPANVPVCCWILNGQTGLCFQTNHGNVCTALYSETMLANKHTHLELTYCFLALCRFAFVFVIMAATDSVQTTKTISLQV